MANALTNYKKSVEIRERLTREDPANVGYMRDLMITYGNMGDLLGSPTKANLGDPAGALESYNKMLAIAARVSSADPTDKRAMSDYAIALMRTGNIIPDDGDNEKALATFNRSAGMMEKLAAADPKNTRLRMNLIFVYRRLGDRHLIAGNRVVAMRNYERAIQIGEALVAADPKDTENGPALEQCTGTVSKSVGGPKVATGEASAAFPAPLPPAGSRAG